MSKSTREKLLRYLALFGAAAAVSSACDRPQYTYSDDVPLSGNSTSSFAGTFTAAGASTIGGGAPTDPCALDRLVGAAPVMAKQVVSNNLAGRSELYAELTDAEVINFKEGGSLLLPPPVTPFGSSPLDAMLTAAGSASPTWFPLVQQVRARFKATRAAWPNPWALRLVEHGGSEHMNPLRIRLRDDAWILRLIPGAPGVVDVKNAQVALDAALEHPERIAAVFYVYDDRTPGTLCDDARREFALGNTAMVAEFSLGTAEILTRLNADIEDLAGLFNVVRPCMTVDHGLGTFHSNTACQTWKFFDSGTEYSAYEWSLSDPVELYKPSTQNLASLIDALKNDRFEPDDPFIVTPDSQPSEGGAGGAGDGAGGAGGATDHGGAAQGGAP